ncbi:hypothetical protein [Winogradskyella haliclonae]|uniref:TIGR04086 family membrane protein n=1 Tax=Winogradskyella haliclonae TaxID=2048558 RepID=A0ABQ2C0F7_9FLAO|nr:hypothetical protein [Winogradskyella haliclonae]GGI57944.1 hypothetical protein GCM10011444_22530 [Winogradskyella haliclonae]
MNTKSFIAAGLVGGIVDWLLGWLFYGIIFADKFPQPDAESNAMIYITLGCLAFGFFISYIYNKWANISTFGTGLKAGAIIGLFMGLISNFFRLAEQASENFEMFGIDLAISIVMAALVGGVVGFVNGKVGSKS